VNGSAPSAPRGPYRARPGTIPTLPIPDARGWRTLHLVGVGGAGMSGLARLLLARGIAVTGSDLKWSQGMATLQRLGATVFVGHRAEQIGAPDAVVVSSAIPRGNPEVQAASRAGVPVLMRAQLLAALMRGHRGVAVAGTHGKTTTTSMVSVILTRAGLAPTFVIGGDLNESGSGAEHGGGDVFVAEADESDGSFLLLEPDVAVITNVERDHVDFYGSPEEVEEAFAAFALRSGHLVACWDDPGVRRALAGTPTPLLRYGTGEGLEIVLREVGLGSGTASGTVDVSGEHVGVELSVPGVHNLLNAAAALGVAHLLGVALGAAAEALRSFGGVRRRFEARGVARGASFFDDYAHHPTEVEATLRAARTDGRRIVAIFQPHRYTRTRAMWRELGESLGSADVVVVTDVYGAGEAPIPGVTGKLVVDALAEASPGKRVVYLPRRADIASFLAGEVRAGDLVLTLGAGDITMVGEETLERLRETAG
jgi:UDP-N-acetylmuramate--alanine ligase